MTAPLVPPEPLDPVVAYFNPRRVILFGSRARGDAGPDSDVDLLVIVDDDTPAEKITLRAGFESHQSYHEPADVFPVREATCQCKSQIAGTLSRAATLAGIVVYGTPNDPNRSSGPGPADIWQEVLAWLRVADSDQRAARVCMISDPPVHNAAAFHCHQAAEKLLKGFLVHASIDLGKTHDLGRLGRVVASHFPSVAPLVTAIDDWTAWRIAYCYPDLAEPQPEPSAEGLAHALDLISRLARALRSRAPPGADPGTGGVGGD
jgi:HEPN domain-containing protein